MSETHFAKQTRVGIEGRIKEGFEAHDITAVNYQLDLYPTGRRRPELSNDQMAARLEGKPAQRFFTSLGDSMLCDTVELPIVRLA